MARFQHVSRTALILGLLGGTTASADVTAQDVWDNWKEQLSVYGEAGVVIGEETMSGDTLTVDSVLLSMADDDSSVTAEIGPMTFTEQRDGSVVIGMPESYPMNLNLEGEPITVTVTQEDLVIVVSGTPEEMSYDVTADRYQLTLDDLGPEFQSEGTINAAFLAMTDVDGSYMVRTGNLRFIDYALNVGGVEIDFDITENAGNGVVQIGGTIDGLVAAAKIAMPLNMDMENPDDAFVNGLAIEGGYTFGASSYDMNIDMDGEAVNGDATIGQGGLEMTFDKDGMRYFSSVTDVALNMFVPNELPFPIEASLGEYGVRIDVPLSQSDEPRDFEAGIALRDLVVADGLWNLVDPGAILPRDPATVALNLTGKVTPFFDFLDPEQQQAAAMTDVPGEINSLTLNELTVQVAGAEVLGTGAFTFDNDDLQTYDGVPRPDGTVDMQINGINGLIDKLTAMGLVPEDQAMMPRMMLGMFATPVGDDRLTSTIEFTPEGQILANGQRLK